MLKTRSSFLSAMPMIHSTLDPVAAVFLRCTQAMRSGTPAVKASVGDKEFFFQRWVGARFAETTMNFDEGPRTGYPDFTLVHHAQGYEVKGLASPGRDKNFDCNSRLPSGIHNGRDIFYVFGRYPKTDDLEVAVSDLVIVHGDFLDAQHEYIHKNKSIKGFGTYGDIQLRDRKMYVAPTPYALLEGVVGRRTLVVPEEGDIPDSLRQVGSLVRVEAERMLVGYSFDLRTNKLVGQWAPNPSAGVEHRFVALREGGDAPHPVSLS